MGDLVGDITGVVTQAFGFYRILPLTAIKTSVAATATPPKLSISAGTGTCAGLTVGDYNVENMAPTSSHIPKVAAHIVDKLLSPDLVFVQEIQDGSGPTDDGNVSGNATLAALTKAISTYSNGTTNYSWVQIDPVDGQDGGQPGGNIRQAYLYKPEVLSLNNPNPGSSTDANEVLPGPALKFNPGRIDPTNDAWNSSRKPLVAEWIAVGSSKPFFTVNVHWASKGGSSSLHGDMRPPVNGVVQARISQADVTAVSPVSPPVSPSRYVRLLLLTHPIPELHRSDPRPGC
jgi:predicted extracellular nuclease